jgi:uncharacterized damage-inducible protein DinB
MSRATRLARHIERTISGPMWHGPALEDVLEGVTHAHAAARPIPSAHSIWELVLHVTAWAEIARARLHGERIGDPTAAEDWPAPTAISESDLHLTSGSDLPGSDRQSRSDPENPDRSWQLSLTRLAESYRDLAADARELDDATLDAIVPGLEYPAWILLQGVVEHGAYHAGQIALLRKTL